MAATPVLIDTDPGTDDAIALLMALGPPEDTGLQVMGITTVGGNASLARTTRNTLAILEYAGRGRIPVAKGASRPLRGTFPYAYDFHGPGGLSARLPKPRLGPITDGAAELLYHSLSGSPGTTLVALGPLTNVAMLLRRHSRAHGLISRLVIMGGAVGVAGNVTPHAEFNFYSDPVAAREVLDSGLPITLVDLRVSREATIGRDRLRLLKGSNRADLARRILANWFKRHPDRETYDMCDPLAMAVAIEPDIVETRRGRVRVTARRGETLGKSVFEGLQGSVRVTTAVDNRRFDDLLHRLLA